MSLVVVDEQFVPIAKGLIETATKSIFLSTFKAEMSKTTKGKKLREFFELIAKKANDGIDVRFLINWHEDRKSVPKTNQYIIQFCKQNNIKIRHLKFNRCCHAKLIIIDRQKAICGSHNLSQRSVDSNFEVSVVLANQEDVRPLIATYDNTWSNALKA